jgi:hypothetical protein
MVASCPSSCTRSINVFLWNLVRIARHAGNLVPDIKLDFLPFKCQQCQLIYCQDHRFAHECFAPAPPEKLPVADLGKIACQFCKAMEITTSKCLECGLDFCLKYCV